MRWLALPLVVLAAPAAAQSFVDAERDGLLAAMPQPPADDSVAGRADLTAVKLIEGLRTPALAAEAAADADLGPRDWLLRALGPDYAPERHPAAWALFDRARADMTRVVDVVKAKGPQRPRPAARDASVRPSLSIEGHGANSWPSGRAAATRAWAGVGTDLFPERAAALAAAAHRSSALRVIGGVHYPSDLLAGEALADAFLARLRADTTYQAELARARRP